MNAFGTPESIGESNKKLILRRLRERGSLSRADLSRAIGLSFTAISSNVRYLLEHGYIRESGTGDNSHGRKSTLLSFNADRGFVIGVDIGRTKIRCMTADLLGRPVAGGARSRDAGKTGDEIAQNVVDAVAGAVAGAGAGRNRILCICVGTPGVASNGVLRLAPYFPDFSVDALRTRLGRAYSAPVLVENGVNLGAIGEHLSQTGSRYPNLAYVSYGVGLGAALILGGRLHTGFNNAAGEIGFMQIDQAAVPRRFRESGPLETAMSPGRTRKGLYGRVPARSMAELLAKYAEGKKAARTLLDAVSLRFAMAITNICVVANPQAVIVSGGLGKALGERFLPAWRAHLECGLPFPPEILLSDLDDRETMIGAIGTAVNHVESMPIGEQ